MKPSEESSGKNMVPADKLFSIRGPCTMNSSTNELHVYVEPKLSESYS